MLRITLRLFCFVAVVALVAEAFSFKNPDVDSVETDVVDAVKNAGNDLGNAVEEEADKDELKKHMEAANEGMESMVNDMKTGGAVLVKKADEVVKEMGDTFEELLDNFMSSMDDKRRQPVKRDTSSVVQNDTAVEEMKKKKDAVKAEMKKQMSGMKEGSEKMIKQFEAGLKELTDMIQGMKDEFMQEMKGQMSGLTNGSIFSFIQKLAQKFMSSKENLQETAKMRATVIMGIMTQMKATFVELVKQMMGAM